MPVRRVGRLVYTAGCGPNIGSDVLAGKLGVEFSVDQGQDAARRCVMNLLSVLHAHLGNLNRIKSVVKLLGFVAGTADFSQQPEVMNGASQLLNEVFGERGRHARSAIGTNALPGNIPVEIELICEL